MRTRTTRARRATHPARRAQTAVRAAAPHACPAPPTPHRRGHAHPPARVGGSWILPSTRKRARAATRRASHASVSPPTAHLATRRALSPSSMTPHASRPVPMVCTRRAGAAQTVTSTAAPARGGARRIVSVARQASPTRRAPPASQRVPWARTPTPMRFAPVAMPAASAAAVLPRATAPLAPHTHPFCTLEHASRCVRLRTTRLRQMRALPVTRAAKPAVDPHQRTALHVQPPLHTLSAVNVSVRVATRAQRTRAPRSMSAQLARTTARLMPRAPTQRARSPARASRATPVTGSRARTLMSAPLTHTSAASMPHARTLRVRTASTWAARTTARARRLATGGTVSTAQTSTNARLRARCQPPTRTTARQMQHASTWTPRTRARATLDTASITTRDQTPTSIGTAIIARTLTNALRTSTRATRNGRPAQTR